MKDYYGRKAQQSLEMIPLLKGLVVLALGIIFCEWLLNVAIRMLGD